MPEASSWPPPPNIANAPKPHDAFLTACVLNSSDKKPVSRLRLMRDLHKNQGTDLRESLAIVNSFCDRHQILLPPRGFAARCASVLSLANVVIIIVFQVALYFLQHSRNAAVTRLARVAITNEIINIGYVAIGLIVTLTCISVTFILRNSKEQRRAAEDARQKLLSQEAAPP